MTTWDEVVLAAVGVLATGAVSWWAGYVTRGASRAWQHDKELKAVRDTIGEHEAREEATFNRLRGEIREMRDDVQGLVGQVGEMHGELSAIGKFIRNGGRKE